MQNNNERLQFLAQNRQLNHKPTLKYIKAVLRELGNPEKKVPVIHLAGTNGKGSTAAMLYSILMEAGYRVGLYTSPHLSHHVERIRINSKLISIRKFNQLLARIFLCASAAKLNYFEVITALAFLYFAEAKIDLLVLETGLGGRFDATNVVSNKLASIITSIDYDHVNILGKTFSAIAKEKGGIIQDKTPAIVYTGHAAADKVIAQICKIKKASLFLLGRNFNCVLEKIDWMKSRQLFSYYSAMLSYENLILPFIGAHQLRNAALALTTIAVIKNRFPVARTAIYEGLYKASWPGRLEVIKHKISGYQRNIILDGAHNVAGAKNLIETLAISPYREKGIVFVISVLQDKDYKGICRELSALARKIIIFKINSERSLESQVLAKVWRKYLPSNKIFIINELHDLSKILDNKDKNICITGSLYGIAEARKKLI